MSNNLGDDLRTIVLAGVGAMALLVEKSREWVEELSEKGEQAIKEAEPVFEELEKKGDEVIRQGKILGEDLIDNVKKALETIKTDMERMDLEAMEASLDELSDDSLAALKEKLDEVALRRRAEAQDADEQEGESATRAGDEEMP